MLDGSHVPTSVRCSPFGTLGRGRHGADPWHGRTRRRCRQLTATLDRVSRPLDPAIAETVMLQAGLEPREPYPGRAVVPWKCRCLRCGTDVLPSYNAVQQGGGCRICSGRALSHRKRLDPDRAATVMRTAGAEPKRAVPRGIHAVGLHLLELRARDNPALQQRRTRPRPLQMVRPGGSEADSRRVGIEQATELLRRAGAEPSGPYPGRLGQPWPAICTRCGREISPRLSTVIQRGTDPCPYCAGARVHPEDAVAVMREAGAEPQETYPGARRPWKCFCVRCGRTVRPWFSQVRAGSGACGYCAKRKLDPDEAAERMRAAGVQPHGAYPGKNDVPWPGTCMRCGDAIAPTLATAIDPRGAGGCNRCANASRGNAQRIPPEQAAELIRHAGAEPLEPYVDGGTPWRCRCLRCDREVTPRLWLVQQGVKPCPACSVYGFDRTSPAVVYLVTHPLLNAHKIGVAGVDSRRLDHHRAQGWNLHCTVAFDTGAEAHRVEQAVLRWMRDDRGWPPFLASGSGWDRNCLR